MHRRFDYTHRKQFFNIVPIIVLLVFMASPLFAQTKISGLVFGDYYYVVRDHNPDLKNKNGFQLRRVYITFDHQFAEPSLSARVRLEANSPGDFTSTTKIEPYIKHLYLQYKPNGNHTAYFGLSGPPTFAVVEEVWGYRHVEKTPLDLYSFAPSSDFGIAMKGNLNSRFKYHGMVSNGSGTGGETNSGKRASFSLGYYPNKTFLTEGYVDTESRSGNEDRQTYQAFVAIHNSKARVGVMATRINRHLPNLNDNFDVASVFAVYKVAAKTNILSRYDRMFNPNPVGAKIAYMPFDPKARSNFVLVGLDHQVGKNLFLIPNVEYVLYDGLTPRPSSDLMPRFTVFFTF